MRGTLGIAVFAGMLGVTAFGILLTPVFYYCLERLSSMFSKEAAAGSESTPPSNIAAPSET